MPRFPTKNRSPTENCTRVKLHLVNDANVDCRDIYTGNFITESVLCVRIQLHVSAVKRASFIVKRFSVGRGR